MQDETLVGGVVIRAADLNEPGEIGLLGRRVDIGVAVVVEEPEVLVQAHVDARRLDHRRVPGVQAHPPGLDLGPDVPVREQHEGHATADGSVAGSEGAAAARTSSIFRPLLASPP